MPLCAFGDSRLRHDYTQVENAFVRDYLPTASGNAVKVYLYGLMQCQCGVGEGTIATFAAALCLSEEDVLDAFDYWQALGLCVVSHSPQFCVLYQSAAQALPVDVSLYTQSALNTQIQSLFLPKSLSPAQLRRVYDWMDVFRLEPEAVIMLIHYGRSKMGNLDKASITRQLQYLDTIARQWADEGMHGAEQVEEWLQGQQQHQSGLTALLKRLGLHRQPTGAERALYQSWLALGFDAQAILLAADRTTGIRQPSLDTVNNILLSLHQQGAHSADSVLAENSEALCKEALSALGLRQPTPSLSQLEAYREWRAGGFGHELILLACEICRDQGHRTIKDIRACLLRWQALQLQDVRAIRTFESERHQREQALEQLFSVMGRNARVQPADLALYEQWQGPWSLSDELLLYAAECSHGAVSPFRMMKKLAQQWHEAGISSVSAARAFQATSPAATAKTNPALLYEQRPIRDTDDDVHWI